MIKLLQAAHDALEEAKTAQATMRDWLSDYFSVLTKIQENPDSISAYGIKHELDRLEKNSAQFQHLVRHNVALPEDSCCVRLYKVINRCFEHKDITKKLLGIDSEVTRQRQFRGDQR